MNATESHGDAPCAIAVSASMFRVQWRFPRSPVERKYRWKDSYFAAVYSRQEAERQMQGLQMLFPLHEFRIQARAAGQRA